MFDVCFTLQCTDTVIHADLNALLAKELGKRGKHDITADLQFTVKKKTFKITIHNNHRTKTYVLPIEVEERHGRSVANNPFLLFALNPEHPIVPTEVQEAIISSYEKFHAVMTRGHRATRFCDKLRRCDLDVEEMASCAFALRMSSQSNTRTQLHLGPMSSYSLYVPLEGGAIQSVGNYSHSDKVTSLAKLFKKAREMFKTPNVLFRAVVVHKNIDRHDSDACSTYIW